VCARHEKVKVFCAKHKNKNSCILIKFRGNESVNALTTAPSDGALQSIYFSSKSIEKLFPTDL
jgi:hypothetical protein